MEFFNQGQKKNISFSNSKNPTITEYPQISYLHCLGSLYAAIKYLESNGKKIESRWNNVPSWTYDAFNPEKFESLIYKAMSNGILQIKAADTLKPILEWIREINWKLNGIESLEVPSNSVLVAIKSQIEYNSWSNDLYKMSFDSKVKIINDFYGDCLFIKNGSTFSDFHGNNIGFYRLKNEKGNTTIRLTHWKNGSFDEVMEKHLIDSGFVSHTGRIFNSSLKSYEGFSFISFKKKLNTKSLNPILGATNNEYQIKMVAGDGIVQINKNNPLRYEMKSLAMAVFRCIPEEKDLDESNYLKLYDEDEEGNITTRMIVELIYEGLHIAAFVVTHEDVDLAE